MKAKLLTLILAIALLTGCAVGFKNEKSQDIAIDVAASTIGYYVGKNNAEIIPEWLRWLEPLLALEQGDTVMTYEDLLAKGFDLVLDEPFLEMQLKKLINLLEFPELQPSEAPFLTGPYIKMVRLILGGFQEGLMAAKAELEKETT
jgi:hypothetical protein